MFMACSSIGVKSSAHRRSALGDIRLAFITRLIQ
jgi:hypothetical protein